MNFISEEKDLQFVEGLQALYFYTSWMPYHKKMLVMIDKMEEKFKDIPFTAVNADDFKSQCKRFDIESVPTIVVLKGGKEIKRINGLVLTSAFRSALADICTK